MQNFTTLLLAALVSDTVVALLVAFLLKRRTETLTHEIRTQYEKLSTEFRTRYNWKEKAVVELLAPINMQLNRTERALQRYVAGNLYLEAKILKEGNEAIRNLLVEKGHLIPASLLPDADKLIEHYDIWLEEFARVRNADKPDLDTKFVFVGSKGFPFPRASADKFQATYLQFWRELYGPPAD